MTTTLQKTFAYFAELLTYPTPRLENQARTCLTLLAVDFPEAAQYMQTFRERTQTIPTGRMEEIYTGTFDVNPTCFIYAGYMMFGESFKRGKFMVRLQEEYRTYGFDRGDELPDHMAVLMRFLSTVDVRDPFVQSLIDDCLMQVLEKMIAGFNIDGDNPYLPLLMAIAGVLEKISQPEPVM